MMSEARSPELLYHTRRRLPTTSKEPPQQGQGTLPVLLTKNAGFRLLLNQREI